MGVYTQTTTIANGNTADGGEVNTEIVALGASVNSVVDAQVASGADVGIAKLKDGSVWADWTPTLDTNGAGTTSAPSIALARWMRMGPLVFFQVNATCTIASSDGSTTAIRFTLPVNTTATSAQFVANVKDPGTDTFLNVGQAQLITATVANKVSVFRITKAENAVEVQKVWSNGTSRQIWVQGFYEVA